MTTITIDGTDHEMDEYCIRLADDMWWVPFHTWGDGTDQIDARVVSTTGVVVPGGLDLWAVDVARAEFGPDNVARIVDAEAVWDTGRVLSVGAEHFGGLSLFVPGSELNTELVHAALARFKP